jgi:hypothetical protein
MIEYLRSDNLPLTLSYSASAYAGNVYFEVYDLDTEEFIQGGKGVPRASSAFSITLNADSTAYDRNLKIEYVTTSASGAFNDIQYVSLIRPYASINRIVDLAEIDVTTLGSASASKLQRLERRARLSINSYLGFNFYKEKRTATVYGNNTDVLTLPYPIYRIDAIYEDDILIYQRDSETDQLEFPVEIGPSSNRIKIVNSSEKNKETLEFPKFSVFYYDGLFKKDFSYKIDGIWGWEYIPSEIEEATALLVNDYLCNDFNVRNKNISQLSNDSYNIKYNADFATGIGNLLVDNLLAPYREPRYMVI